MTLNCFVYLFICCEIILHFMGIGSFVYTHKDVYKFNRYKSAALNTSLSLILVLGCMGLFYLGFEPFIASISIVGIVVSLNIILCSVYFNNFKYIVIKFNGDDKVLDDGFSLLYKHKAVRVTYIKSSNNKFMFNSHPWVNCVGYANGDRMNIVVRQRVVSYLVGYMKVSDLLGLEDKESGEV